MQLLQPSCPEPDPIHLADVLKVVKGRLVRGGTEGVALGVSIDSRRIRPGQLFVALKGERYDGHDFIPQSFKEGVCAALIQEGRKLTRLSGPARFGTIIAVPDTLAALGDLAAEVREKHSIPLVAVTGSNGKTTTKEVLASILRVSLSVLKSPGNFNNLVGLPLTLLEMNRHHQVAVVELGMNRPGEIKRLSEICRPDVGVVTNIGPVHLEGLVNIEGVGRAKGEILSGLKEMGTIVFNGDDPRSLKIFGSWQGRVVTFGTVPKVGVRLIDYSLLGTASMVIGMDLGGETIRPRIKALGMHNVENALAATAAAVALGIPTNDIIIGLERFRPMSRRTEIVHLGSGITLIDDSYNANPKSMEMALELLKRVAPRRKVALLADMRELGETATRAHYQLGLNMVRAGVDLLLFLGSYGLLVAEGAVKGGMDRDSIILCSNHKEAIGVLAKCLKKDDFLLVKGSRAMALEKVVDALKGVRHEQEVSGALRENRR